MKSQKTSPEAQPPKLLDQVSAKMRLLHYSKRTESSYVDWIKRYILFHNKRHPREMGAAEIESFLTHLAVEGKVAASTQNQAFSALLFLYQKILEIELPRLNALRAQRPEHLPVVLAIEEIRTILAELDGIDLFMAEILYGAGLRILESEKGTSYFSESFESLRRSVFATFSPYHPSVVSRGYSTISRKPYRIYELCRALSTYLTNEHVLITNSAYQSMAHALLHRRWRLEGSVGWASIHSFHLRYFQGCWAEINPTFHRVKNEVAASGSRASFGFNRGGACANTL